MTLPQDEPYTPQVGDRIQREGWRGSWIDVRYADGAYFAGYGEDGEFTYDILDGGPWVKVEVPEPLPERWITFYPGTTFRIDDAQTLPQVSGTGIARLHFWSDESGDHAEIERITP